MKKLVSFITITSMVISLAGCSNQSKEAAQTSSDTIYQIGICRDDENDYNSIVTEGYKDALIDAFGEDHLVFIEQTASTSPSASTAVETILQAGVDDLFTYGNNSLSAASELTRNTPIIFAGVYNYEDVLKIVSTGDNSATNVTGISSMPNITEQVSLLIEACDNRPSTVGIPYAPSDSQSILQNELLETILDEAGIPWKEYEIKSGEVDTSTTNNDDNIVTANNITLPEISSAASGKDGTNTDVDSIGNDGDLTGINEPMSARTAQVSRLWSGAGISDNCTIEDAFNECSAIYFCQDNTLCNSSEFMTKINNLAVSTSTVTIGGDETIGQNTLVSLYEDPYDIGYRCGKKSISILTEEKPVDEISIDSPSASKTTKLYNSDISDSLGKTWPKSFHELDDYLDSYEPGSLTDRIESE